MIVLTIWLALVSICQGIDAHLAQKHIQHMEKIQTATVEACTDELLRE